MKFFLILLFSFISLISSDTCGSGTFDSTKGKCYMNKYCQCFKPYATHPYDNQEYCTYKRKKQWLAFVLEAVVAFGAGHFYTENYERAIPKLIFWLIGWFLFITMRVISVKREKIDEVALIFAMLSCVMTIGMIVWYAVDVIMIGLNRYEDGNGINFKSWKSDDDY